VNCSTLRERTAGSPPSTSQVSLLRSGTAMRYRTVKLTTSTIYGFTPFANKSRRQPCRTTLSPILAPDREDHDPGHPLNQMSHKNAASSVVARTPAVQGSMLPPCARQGTRQTQTPKCRKHWAEAHEKIARMTLTIKLDRNWSSFQLANRAPPLSVTDSSIAPSARMGSTGGDAASDFRS